MTTTKSSYKFPAPTLTTSDINNIQSFSFSKDESGLDVAITGKFVLYSE